MKEEIKKRYTDGSLTKEQAALLSAIGQLPAKVSIKKAVTFVRVPNRTQGAVKVMKGKRVIGYKVYQPLWEEVPVETEKQLFSEILPRVTALEPATFSRYKKNLGLLWNFSQL